MNKSIAAIWPLWFRKNVTHRLPWSDNEGLRRRGDLTVCFDEEAIANWMADKTGKPGGQRVYSDLAIETKLGRNTTKGCAAGAI